MIGCGGDTQPIRIMHGGVCGGVYRGMHAGVCGGVHGGVCGGVHRDAGRGAQRCITVCPWLLLVAPSNHRFSG